MTNTRRNTSNTVSEFEGEGEYTTTVKQALKVHKKVRAPRYEEDFIVIEEFEKELGLPAHDFRTSGERAEDQQELFWLCFQILLLLNVIACQVFIILFMLLVPRDQYYPEICRIGSSLLSIFSCGY